MMEEFFHYNSSSYVVAIPATHNGSPDSEV